jgi:hypothetical protein
MREVGRNVPWFPNLHEISSASRYSICSHQHQKCFKFCTPPLSQRFKANYAPDADIAQPKPEIDVPGNARAQE